MDCRREGCSRARPACTDWLKLRLQRDEELTSKNCEADVDKQIESTPCYHGHAYWWEQDGDQDDQQSGSSVTHICDCEGF